MCLRHAAKCFVCFVSESSSHMSEMCRLPHPQVIEKSQRPPEAPRLDSGRTLCQRWWLPKCQATGAPPGDGAQSRGTRASASRALLACFLALPQRRRPSLLTLSLPEPSPNRLPPPPFLLEAIRHPVSSPLGLVFLEGTLRRTGSPLLLP